MMYFFNCTCQFLNYTDDCTLNGMVKCVDCSDKLKIINAYQFPDLKHFIDCKPKLLTVKLSKVSFTEPELNDIISFINYINNHECIEETLLSYYELISKLNNINLNELKGSINQKGLGLLLVKDSYEEWDY